ncbi:hypothetical protein [Bacillus amyloliquefaciens]|uniref:hypothetical protein n=1 Tax=Bacillus amyloliquefaciens TaxID=1390 RepID=UPI001ABE39CB|nr:hypothetical protein [Bacillus amyloliquefaciens]QTG87340.1 hypothetical protein J4048_20660 [Bacillus amyloliquefaciens]
MEVCELQPKITLKKAQELFDQATKYFTVDHNNQPEEFIWYSKKDQEFRLRELRNGVVPNSIVVFSAEEMFDQSLRYVNKEQTKKDSVRYIYDKINHRLNLIQKRNYLSEVN